MGTCSQHDAPPPCEALFSASAANHPPHRTVVVLQPGYLPWLGFFDQMHRSDIFIYYDDVQFDKHGWRNRNRVKAPTREPYFLTVPVRHGGLGKISILDIEIDSKHAWVRKQIGTLRQFYGRSPFLKRYLPELEEMLSRPWKRLVDLDLALVDLLCRWLGLQRRIERASLLGIQGERSERLLKLCRHFGATRYLCGNASQAYLNTAIFADNGITVEWQNFAHPVYAQQHGEFVPYLSVIDLLLNCGDESAAILFDRKQHRRAG